MEIVSNRRCNAAFTASNTIIPAPQNRDYTLLVLNLFQFPVLVMSNQKRLYHKLVPLNVEARYDSWCVLCRGLSVIDMSLLRYG
jgi:hypothetical protein